LLGESQPAQAGIWDDLWLTRDQQGKRALEAGDTETASEVFANPAWAGTAAYQGGAYDRAVEQFSALEGADGAYNRGNALARAGKIDEAIEAYRESLEQAPDKKDAQDNLALLEQLKQQQQNQEQESQDDNSDDQNEQQQDQQQSSGDDQQQDSDEDQQQDSSQPPENESQQQDDQPQEQQQEPEQEQDQQQEPSEQEQSSEQEQEAEPAQLSPEEQERDQAMEQWLRRVPDDPSGLLREKFRYESRLRQQQGAKPQDETYW